MKDNDELCKEIYENLPDNCKSWFGDKKVGIANCFDFTKGIQKRIDQGTKDVIDDIYKRCIYHYEKKIIEKDISFRNTKI